MRDLVTKKIRKDAGIQDGDPLAPVCDMLDTVHARMDRVERSMQEMIKEAAVEAAVPHVVAAIAKRIALFLFVALVLLLIALYSITTAIEAREHARADDVISHERAELTVKFDDAVKAQAYDWANMAMRRADDQIQIAQAVIDGKGADPDLRALMSGLMNMSRSDALVIWRLFNNNDPKVSILARLPLNLDSRGVEALYQHVLRAGLIQGQWWEQPFPSQKFRP